MIQIDALANQSKGKKYHTKLRISFTLGLLLLSILIENQMFYLGLFIISSVYILWLSPVKPLELIKLISIPLSFVLLSVVVIMVQITLNELPTAHWFGFSIGSLKIYMTQASVHLGYTTFLRSLSSILVIFSISLTLPMQAQINWMKACYFPSAFIELYTLCYRFIFILIEEAQDMLTAQEMRFGYFSVKNAFKTINQLVVSLFSRAFTRFDDLSQAMDLRFYNER